MTNYKEILIQKWKILFFTIIISYSIHILFHCPFDNIFIKWRISLIIFWGIFSFYFIKFITKFIKNEKISIFTYITYINLITSITIFNLIFNAFCFIKNTIIIMKHISSITFLTYILKLIYLFLWTILNIYTLINYIRICFVINWIIIWKAWSTE